MSHPHVVAGRGLHRFYRSGDDEVAALRDVTIEVAPGEIVAVMGPSGSGKSTLLNVLAGLDDPDGGSVWIDGERISHRRRSQQARMRARLVGVLTQGSGLLDHLSVLNNVALAESFRAGRRSRGVAALLEAVSLSARAHARPATLSGGETARRAHARPATLSGGETARANLAVALAGGPKVLLADEPTAEVSRAEESALLELLRRVVPDDGATILVTHSSAVADAADRVFELRDGKLR